MSTRTKKPRPRRPADDANFLAVVVGTALYGGVFGWWAPLVGGDAYWLKGLVWGAVGWLIASTVMLPMAGNGQFGIKLGTVMPVMSLMMHAVFGLILGAIFGWMLPA